LPEPNIQRAGVHPEPGPQWHCDTVTKNRQVPHATFTVRGDAETRRQTGDASHTEPGPVNRNW
jgi:hypothetical protein